MSKKFKIVSTNTEYKRFVIFMFNDYYPSGGLNDVVYSETTLNKCLIWMKDAKLSRDNCMILDLLERKSWYLDEVNH